MHKVWSQRTDWVIVVSLILLSLAAHIPIAQERKIMPAGDVFNFQHITEGIMRLTYPLNEKRLPGYPLLILLTRPFPIDPISAAVGISLVTSASTLGILYALGRKLRINRVPLTAALGLTIFDPILTVSSVRPLSDATFLFFLSLYIYLVTRQVTQRKPTSLRSLLGLGLATTAMIFTRFEGIPIAAVTLPLLWIRLPWRKVLIASAIPLITGLSWIPAYYAIHGSFTGGYLGVFREHGSDQGRLKKVPENLMTLVRAAGWGNTWTLPNYELEQEPNKDAVARILTNPAWWLSILGLLGVPWLVIRCRLAALPLFLGAIAYIGVLVWWFVYSRFVTPLVPIFYLSAAAGGSFLIIALQRALSSKLIVTILVAIFLIWILWTEAPRLYKQGLGRAWENNQKGYALLQAMRETGRSKQLTVYWTEENIMATFFLKKHGLFLNRHLEATPEEIYQLLQTNQARYLINTGTDERLPQLRQLLRERGNIASTSIYQAPDWHTYEWETTEVDHLSWP